MTERDDRLHLHLANALQNALFGYGADLLLAVPKAPVPSTPSAAIPIAAEPVETARRAAEAEAGPTSVANPGERAPSPAPRPRPAVAAGAPVERPAPAYSPAREPAAPQPSDPLALLRTEAMSCKKCTLCEGRRSVVFGEGARHPDVMFVGEAPGAVEDQTGRPFVGPAGQLLDRILDGAMGLRRDEVYIANINKCRPPGNRDPHPDEVAACLPYLRRQVELLQPKVLVALGRIAAHNLLDTTEPMRDLRGRDLSYQGIPVVVTWHPSFLLRDPSRKGETWADIKRVNRMLGRPEDPRRTNG